MKKRPMENIPDLSGKTAIVTGGNIGLGFKTSLELARNHVRVVIACRSMAKGQAAVKRITAEVSGVELEIIPLDLTDMDSIRSFAAAFLEDHSRLDILMNNAGVVNLEHLERTREGHEMHMATNHLGHFALTGLLSEILVKTPGARVVTLSSLSYKFGTIDFDDFKWVDRSYNRSKSYGDSKLANLLFARQLQTYFKEKGCDALSVAAHPGLTGTERQQSIGIGGRLARWMAAPVDKGVRSQLMAATSPDVTPGAFYGPRFGIWGAPKALTIKPGKVNDSLARELWTYSQALTGVQFH